MRNRDVFFDVSSAHCGKSLTFTHRTPAGKLVIALTNRTTGARTFDIGLLGSAQQFTGYRYDATLADVIVGTSQGTALRLTVPSYAIEFWVQD